MEWIVKLIYDELFDDIFNEKITEPLKGIRYSIHLMDEEDFDYIFDSDEDDSDEDYSDFDEDDSDEDDSE